MLSMALKARRDCEAQLQEQLYSNICLLSILHPPVDSKVQEVLKKDMFAKSNKTAFQHIVYYLLSLLDPKSIKEKIPSWPLLIPRQETEFRNEVMAYINELSSIYKDADVPTLMTSHLVSPGGYKFMRFLLKLTELVMRICLDNDNDLLYPLKPNRNSTVTEHSKMNLKRLTEYVNEDTLSIKWESENYLQNSKFEAENILQHKIDLHSAINVRKDTLKSKRDIVGDDIDKQVSYIQRELEVPAMLQKGSLDITFLISHLLSEQMVLHFDSSRYMLPKELSCNNNESFNNLQFFKKFCLFLDKIHLTMPSINNTFVNIESVKYKQYDQILSATTKRYDNILEALFKASSAVDSAFVTNNNTENYSFDEILAVPLDSLSPIITYSTH